MSASAGPASNRKILFLLVAFAAFLFFGSIAFIISRAHS
jgi:hypothetical protein